MIPINCRRKTQIILIILVLVACSASVVWQPWAGIFSLLFFLLIADYLFLNDEMHNSFDPNYGNWKRKTDPKF